MAHARLTMILVLIVLSVGACARTTPASLSMHEALTAAEAGETSSPPAASVRSGFGYQAPYLPLVVPPEVRRIWITTHVSEEGSLVQGHWVFLPVKTWQWFVEQPQGSNGLGVAVAPDTEPPAWPAPIESGRRALVPWTVDSKAPMSSGHPEPGLEPPAPDAGAPHTRAVGSGPARPSSR